MSKEKKEWEELKGKQIWEPQKVEDELTGVIQVAVEHPQYGMSYEIMTATGEIIKTPYQKLLQDLLEKAGPDDLIKIIYKGEKNVNKGNPLQIYKVYRAKTK